MNDTPIVFLPGASGRSAIWRPVAQRLAHRGPPVFVDYPGLGDAPADPEITSLADLYLATMATLPTLFDVVALSMGCVLALRAAIEYPHRVRRLVLVAASGGVDVARFGAHDWRAGWRAQRPDAPTWFLDDRTDFTAQLGVVVTPTLLLFGDQDPIAPQGVGDFLRTLLPSAELKTIAGGTHSLVEDHAETVARLIDAHLRLR